jgi:hypothetical protein
VNFSVKAIVIFYFFISLVSCNGYIIGGVKVISNNNQDFLNYNIIGKKVFLEGKISGNLCKGRLYSAKQAQKIEIKRNPHINKSYIKKLNIFSFARLQDNLGRLVVECFIKQESKRKLYNGGVGRCYHNNGKSFDIILENRNIRFRDWLIKIQ